MPEEGEQIKTMQVRALVNEAENTGLLDDQVIPALRAEYILAQEKIENLRRMYEQNEISKEEMKRRIGMIQQEIKDKVTALGFDMYILLDEDLSSLKSALLHNAQSSVHIVRLVLKGKKPVPLEDGKVATLEVLTEEEIKKLLGNTPERLRSSIAAAKRAEYNGPLKNLSPADLQKLEALANLDWRVPQNINRLLYELVTRFGKYFKGNIINTIKELSEFISGKREIFVGDICKSTNKATPEQITAYCEENRREFMDWIQKNLDEETNQSPARLAFLRELLAFVVSCDYSDPEELDKIYARLDL
jgi:hypothetical protein